LANPNQSYGYIAFLLSCRVRFCNTFSTVQTKKKKNNALIFTVGKPYIQRRDFFCQHQKSPDFDRKSKKTLVAKSKGDNLRKAL
jgi:hypothetical protein